MDVSNTARKCFVCSEAVETVGKTDNKFLSKVLYLRDLGLLPTPEEGEEAEGSGSAMAITNWRSTCQHCVAMTLHLCMRKRLEEEEGEGQVGVGTGTGTVEGGDKERGQMMDNLRADRKYAKGVVDSDLKGKSFRSGRKEKPETKRGKSSGQEQELTESLLKMTLRKRTKTGNKWYADYSMPMAMTTTNHGKDEAPPPKKKRREADFVSAPKEPLKKKEKALFKCPRCPLLSFRLAEHVTEHAKYFHQEEEKPTQTFYLCPHCPWVSFKYPELVQEHVKAAHQGALSQGQGKGRKASDGGENESGGFQMSQD